MNKLQRTLACSIVLPAIACAAGGCWYAVAGAGAYAGYRFIDGEYHGVIRADRENAVKATRAAFDDLGIRETSVEESDGSTTIKGESEGNHDVRVTLEDAGDDATNVSVRIDTFGDQSFSQIVVDKINDNL